MAVGVLTTAAATITSSTFNSTSIALVMPSVHSDHYLLAFLTFQSNGSNQDTTVTPPAGWTLIAGINDLGTSTSSRLNIYGKVATNSEPSTYTWNFTSPTGANAIGAISALTGVDLAAPIVTSGTNSTMGTTSRTTAVINPASESFVIASWSDRNGSTYTVAGTKLVEAKLSGSASIVAESAGTMPAGAISRTATASASTALSSSVIIAVSPRVGPITVGYPGKIYNGTVAVDGHWVVKSEGGYIEPITVKPMPSGYTSVTDMLSKSQFYCAHRGGSNSFPEMSLYAYTQSVWRKYGALEVSLCRTSDGVWFGLHDAYLDRTSLGTGGTTLNPTTMTWAQVQTYLIKGSSAGANPTQPDKPYSILTDILDAYLSSHVLLIDPKANQAYLAELISILSSYNMNDKLVMKGYGPSSGSLAAASDSAGIATWGYYYESDSASYASTQGNYTFLGQDHAASQGAWTDLLSYGKKVMSHQPTTAAQVQAAIVKGANGHMVAGVAAVPL